MSKAKIRVAIDLDRKTAVALKRLADKRGIDIAEAVHRAIGLYESMDAEFEKGNSIFSMDSSGCWRKLNNNM